jgi:hypothetical protein
MSVTKRILGDYTLQSINATDRVNITTSLVTINGNLIVTGNTSSINSTNTTIWDNIITLNGGLSPGTPPTLDAGIEVDRGTLANVKLLWSETVKAWQLTSDGSTYTNIAVAGGTTSNLDMIAYSIYSSSTNYVKFDDNIAIKTSTVAPTATAGYSTLSAITPSNGGTGLAVSNSDYTNEEIALKKRSIAYSIIFGS